MAVIISGFEWDDGNILHIARYRYTPEKVEEVFPENYRVRRTRDGRYVALGGTLDGRLALVVFERLEAA